MHKHISVRVTCHDNGWNVTVCKDPANNASCLFLPRINEKKDVAAEKFALNVAPFANIL